MPLRPLNQYPDSEVPNDEDAEYDEFDNEYDDPYVLEHDPYLDYLDEEKENEEGEVDAYLQAMDEMENDLEEWRMENEGEHDDDLEHADYALQRVAEYIARRDYGDYRRRLAMGYDE